MKKLLSIIVFSLLFVESAYADCFKDTLKKNIERGRYLLTTSGVMYDVLAGDNFDSMFWISFSDLYICGPNEFEHNGKIYKLYEIINIDDGEKITATIMN